MSNLDHDDDRSSSSPTVPVPLSYAGPLSPSELAGRVSRLAWTSLIVLPFGCPCLAEALFGGVSSSSRFPLMLTAMSAATLLPIAAIVRIQTSRGRRRGFELAAVALGVAVGWWFLLFVLWLAASNLPVPD